MNLEEIKTGETAIVDGASGEVIFSPTEEELAKAEDKIKKEIFRRYNSGITPLQKYDIERAIFIDDPLTNEINC